MTEPRAGGGATARGRWLARFVLIAVAVVASPMLLFAALIYGAALGLNWCIDHA
jgi:hypothetical protein